MKSIWVVFGTLVGFFFGCAFSYFITFGQLDAKNWGTYSDWANFAALLVVAWAGYTIPRVIKEREQKKGREQQATALIQELDALAWQVSNVCKGVECGVEYGSGVSVGPFFVYERLKVELHSFWGADAVDFDKAYAAISNFNDKLSELARKPLLESKGNVVHASHRVMQAFNIVVGKFEAISTYKVKGRF